MGRFSPCLCDQTRAKLMKNCHEIPVLSSNNEQVLASKHRVPCQGAGKYRPCWDVVIQILLLPLQNLLMQVCERQAQTVISPGACSSPLSEMSAQKPNTHPCWRPHSVLPRRVLICSEQRTGAGTWCFLVEQPKLGTSKGCSAPHAPHSL